MKVVTSEFIKYKKVLLRLDIDVTLSQKSEYEVADDFRLEAGLPTVKFCLEHAQKVIVLGHIGRPIGYDERLSTKPIQEWLSKKIVQNIEKLEVLENLRFDKGESFDTEQSRSAQDYKRSLEYAKKLASLGDVYINEAFASWRPASSTTILPKLLPHAIGFRFAKEVKVLTGVRENPLRPMVVIIGGAKVEDKLPVIEAMAKIADAVLVGGLLPKEISNLQKTQNNSVGQDVRGSENLENQNSDISGIPSHSESFRVIPKNVFIGKLNKNSTDIAVETTRSWESLIMGAKMIVGNFVLGQVENPANNQTEEVAKLIIASGAKSVVGGGDTIAYLKKLGLLSEFGFVSVGGGAMLEFLAKGTLPTIEALN